MKFQTLLNSSSFYRWFSHGCGGPGCSCQCSPLAPSVNQGFMSWHFKASRVLFTVISWEKVEACCGAGKATQASPWFCRHEPGRLMKEAASAKFFLHNGPFFFSLASRRTRSARRDWGPAVSRCTLHGCQPHSLCPQTVLSAANLVFRYLFHHSGGMNWPGAPSSLSAAIYSGVLWAVYSLCARRCDILTWQSVHKAIRTFD